MNKVWSELNKTMQTQIKKKDTYEAGINTLFDLRNQLMEILTSFHEELSREDAVIKMPCRLKRRMQSSGRNPAHILLRR